MADSKEVAKENPEIEIERESPHSKQAIYMHGRNIKKGVERLDRRSGTGDSGAMKKSGHGSKFTWNGPTTEVEDYADSPLVALDENDPNYVDPEEEVADRKVAIGEVEVAKVAAQAS